MFALKRGVKNSNECPKSVKVTLTKCVSASKNHSKLMTALVHFYFPEITNQVKITIRAVRIQHIENDWLHSA